MLKLNHIYILIYWWITSKDSITSWSVVVIILTVTIIWVLHLFNIHPLVEKSWCCILVSKEHYHETSKQIEWIGVHLIFKVGCACTWLTIQIVLTLIYKPITVSKSWASLQIYLLTKVGNEVCHLAEDVYTYVWYLTHIFLLLNSL